MDRAAFFEVHKDLPREGPGCAADVDWALGLAALAPDAVICDAGSGPGGDVAALLAHVPQGRVVAVDAHAPFIGQVAARFGDAPRVTGRVADMGRLAALAEAPFDLIWCAGALYFLGIGAGLAAFRKALKPGGLVAFSEPCHFTDPPSAAARAFWEGEAQVTGRAAILERVAQAGFTPLGDRRLPDAAWEEYYRPMDARIAALRPGADTALTAALDENAAEAAAWRAVKDETGYLLVLARAS